jgi:hypothetical protein
LQHFKDELAQRSLNFLVQAEIQRVEPIVMKSTPIVKKSIPKKEKHVAMIEGIYPATRRSVRLMK